MFIGDPKNLPLKEKTILKRQGNQFVEQDFYHFDPYARSVSKMIKRTHDCLVKIDW